jgi:sugar phosphate isomerase/epimerase
MRTGDISRRQMITRVGGAAAALGLGGAMRALRAEDKPKGFKIGVCDWMTGKGGNPDVLRVAAELGLDGVMVSFGGPGGTFDLRKPETVKAWEEASKKHGTVISSLGMACLNGTPYKSDPATEQWVSDSIDAAKAVNVTVVLLAFFGKGDLLGDKAGTEEVIKRLKKVAPKAEKEGVILGLESWLSADDTAAIMDAVGSPAVQMYYDVGNSQSKGYDIYKEIRQIGKRVCEFHAKDYSNKPFGQGVVNFPDVRKAMDDVGWRGWIQLEGSAGGNLMKRYAEDREYLRTVFPKEA